MTEEIQRAFNEYGVNTGEWKILSTLYHDRAKSPGEISSYIGFTGAAVTRILDSLEQKGLLVRKPGANRRSIIVDLTKKGRELTPIISQLSKNTNEEFLAALDEEERIRFKATIRKILENRGVKQPRVEEAMAIDYVISKESG
jgi:DNA-binding MarR family transcriptional regulator